jgi:hypothetical protein
MEKLGGRFTWLKVPLSAALVRMTKESPFCGVYPGPGLKLTFNKPHKKASPITFN